MVLKFLSMVYIREVKAGALPALREGTVSWGPVRQPPGCSAVCPVGKLHGVPWEHRKGTPSEVRESEKTSQGPGDES